MDRSVRNHAYPTLFKTDAIRGEGPRRWGNLSTPINVHKLQMALHRITAIRMIVERITDSASPTIETSSASLPRRTNVTGLGPAEK
jgi:hypothetical protein